MKIFFTVFIFCCFFFESEVSCAQKFPKGSTLRVSTGKISEKLAAEIKKSTSGSLNLPKTPHIQAFQSRFFTSHFANQKVQNLKASFTPMPEENFAQLLKRNQLSRQEVLDVQTQIFQVDRSEDAKKLLMLNKLPALVQTHGFALLPSFQTQAVQFYRKLLNEYAGASVFSGKEDFDSWGEALAAISDLGLFGGQKDADVLIQVYYRVPSSAKQVTAVTIMRALLSLNAPEALASFAQIAAKDGVLTEEFSSEITPNETEFVPPSAQELEQMRQAATHFQTLNALHFDFSPKTTVLWMKYKHLIQKASYPLDLSGFIQWQKDGLRQLSQKELQQILSEGEHAIAKGMADQSVKNLISLAKMEWASRFKQANAELVKNMSLEELARRADYTRYKDPAEALKIELKEQQATDFALLQKKRALLASLPKRTVLAENDLRTLGEIFADSQQFNPDKSIITDSSRRVITETLLEDKKAPSFLEKEGLLDVFLNQMKMYYRVKLRDLVQRSFRDRKEFINLRQDFIKLKAKYPAYDWKAAEDVFYSFFKTPVMRQELQSAVIDTQYYSFPLLRMDFETIFKLQESYPHFWLGAEGKFWREFQYLLDISFRHQEIEEYFRNHQGDPRTDSLLRVAHKTYVDYAHSAKNSIPMNDFTPHWEELEQAFSEQLAEFNRKTDALLAQLKVEMARPLPAESPVSVSGTGASSSRESQTPEKNSAPKKTFSAHIKGWLKKFL